MRSVWSYLLATLFLAAIATPLVVMQFAPESNVSLIEKRRLAEKPALHLSVKEINSFPGQYEKYFNDHFGLRDRLVSLYNGLFVTFLQTSPLSHTIVGKDKWLFRSVESMVQDFMGQHLFDDATLHHWKQILRDREEWLADQGIRYLFIPPPNKIMIYPEYLPDRIRRRAGKTNLEQFLEHLAKPPAFTSVIDLRPALLAAKKGHQLYFRGDTHWNLEGAYVGYVSIIQAIRQWFPELRAVPREQMIKTTRMLSGDLTYTLNLAEMYKETYLFLKPPNADSVIHYEDFAGYPQPDTPVQKFRRGELFTNENPSQQRTALFISDSFGSALRDFLAPHFKRIVFVKNARFEDMKRLIEIEKPDIVFDLNVARGLHVALGENVEIRDYILKKHPSRYRVVLDVTAENFTHKLGRSAQVTVSTEKSGVIEATGVDPQLYFTLPRKRSGGNLALYCEMTSPAATVARLYYQTKEHPYYSEEKLLQYPLAAGKNSFYLRIYETELLDTVRFDPGELPGRYTIEKFTISSESGDSL